MRARLSEAVSQIAEIHAVLARSEVYRGFRSLPVALSGVCGLAAEAARDAVLGPRPSGTALVQYWGAVAVFAALVGLSETAYNYVRHEDPFARRKTRRVLGQFLPCLAAGLAATFALCRRSPDVLSLLPGLWAIFFGLGLFAARPYLPRAIGWVALYYVGVGAGLLAVTEPGPAPDDHHVGLTFGAGQIAAGLVLYWNLERRTDHAGF